MAYLDANGDPCVSPGIVNHNAKVSQYIEEFRLLQNRLMVLSSSLKVSLPALGNDDKIEDCITECLSLLAQCEQQCTGYYMY